ncbi:ATP-binding protein [Bartonella sp. B10]
MDKGFDNIEKSSSTSVHWIVVVFCFVFVIAFLFIVGFLGFFYPKSYFYKAALVFFLAFAVIGFVTLILIIMGKISYKTEYLHEDFDLSIFNDADEVFIVSDLSGCVYYSNHSYRKIITYRPDASCYAVIADLSGSGSLSYRLKVAACSNRTTQEELRTEQPIFNHSTQRGPVWYNIFIQPITKRRKKFLLWRITDVSHLQNCRESFFSSFQEAVDHLEQTSVGFLSVNAHGIILYANAFFAEWFSIGLVNFTVGQYNFDQLFCSSENNSAWSDICLQSHKYQHLGYSMPYTFSLRVSSEDGSEKILNCFMCSSSLSENEIVYRIIMIPQQRQKKNDEFQPKLQSALVEYFDVSPFAIAVVNQKGQLVYSNRPFSLLMGYTGKNTKLYDIISQYDSAQLEHAFQKIATNKDCSVLIETVLENNKERHLRLHIVPAASYHIDELQNWVIVSVTEITEQKTLEDKMVQSQKMQAVGQLAGGIAHDFNNVLTAIVMSCDLLLNTHRSSDPAYADLINIKNNANRAAALVQQLLAFSRKQTLRPEKVDFTEFLSDIRNLILPLLGTSIQLKIIHGRDLWSVEVDQASFQRVIMNLVINARDAMPKGGTITIATNNITKQQSAELDNFDFAIGEYVQLTISDTGTGISPSIQEKIFEPFFTTKEVGKGTGLGLSMVYGIIKQTGGYIYCDSREEEGAKFHIFLPRCISETGDKISWQIQKVDKERKNEEDKSADLTGSATVLLVEDEDSVRIGGVRALKMRGYNVLEAASGMDALAILEENKGAIDIIVSDVVMPEMDGPTLFKEVRQNYPDIKFIFISGYTKDNFTKNLPQNASFGFLSKPFTLKQLAIEVKKMLAQ